MTCERHGRGVGGPDLRGPARPGQPRSLPALVSSLAASTAHSRPSPGEPGPVGRHLELRPGEKRRSLARPVPASGPVTVTPTALIKRTPTCLRCVLMLC